MGIVPTRATTSDDVPASPATGSEVRVGSHRITGTSDDLTSYRSRRVSAIKEKYVARDDRFWPLADLYFNVFRDARTAALGKSGHSGDRKYGRFTDLNAGKNIGQSDYLNSAVARLWLTIKARRIAPPPDKQKSLRK